MIHVSFQLHKLNVKKISKLSSFTSGLINSTKKSLQNIFNGIHIIGLITTQTQCMC